MADAPAVLFDVDGTLVDSNYLHVYAWTRAFEEAGVAVESWRIHRSIGMDGDRLIQSLAGDAGEDAQQRGRRVAHPISQGGCAAAARTSRRAGTPGTGVLTRLAGRTRQLSERGGVVDVAKCARLRRPDLCRDVIKGCRNRQTRPGHRRHRACRRAGVDADRAVYVGDAVWDIIACGRIGVPAIGLLSGGVSRDELEKAGAEAVFDNPRDLCEHIDSSPIAALAAKSVG